MIQNGGGAGFVLIALSNSIQFVLRNSNIAYTLFGCTELSLEIGIAEFGSEFCCLEGRGIWPGIRPEFRD
jgi:hypothetical protein